MPDMKNLDCLLDDTRELLLSLIDTASFLKNYVLVGGSALALHLCHRKSEDLDFFTYADAFNKDEIFAYLERFKNKEIINQSNDQVDVLINGIKVTFFNAQWNFLRPETIKPFNLAPPQAIAAMKVNTLFLRAKYRDYYDLYFLTKELFSLQEIFEYSKNIVEGVNFKLFSVALVYIDDIGDDDIQHLEPSVDIKKEDIRAYFEQQIKRCRRDLKAIPPAPNNHGT